MPRPKHKRLLTNPPAIEGFKPFGIPIRDLEPVILLFEEYDSIRLCDYKGMTQEQAAVQMGISVQRSQGYTKKPVGALPVLLLRAKPF